MSYKALYRTYRPADFNEVAGQEHITTTLKNALRNNKVAHAYLFTGPRGTGKTSIAKIFAKAINCEHAPTENPCNVCPNCLGIQDGTISDVIEIDAASNNGVDEIRELRDKVKYLPGYVKYKVYIIDEVHMLSTGAFNALLKTLEEPPSHVIFILCTTEPQKIPLTIISRCQRFDFKAITVKEIIGKLTEIIEKEHIEIDKDAVEQIAIYAEGGLRDAIGLLDQAYAYDPDVITLDDINQICGAVSFANQIEIVKALRQSDSSAAIQAMDGLISDGKEVQKICQNLIQFFRDVLVYKNVGMTDDTSSLYTNAEFIELTKTMNNRRLFFYLDILNKTQNDIKWSNSPRLYLELALIKMTDDEPASEAKLLDAMENLEKRLLDLEKNPRPLAPAPSPAPVVPIKSEPIKETGEQPDFDNKKAEIPAISEQSLFSAAEDEPNRIVEPESVLPSEPVFEAEIPTEENAKPKNELTKCIANTYPIEFVEEVLNKGNREDKNDLINRWDLIKSANQSGALAQYAAILGAGNLVASSGDKIIITLSSAGYCNRMMTPSMKAIGREILKNAFRRDMDYMTLPVEVFKSISDEFARFWRQNKQSTIKLSPIVCADLRDVSGEESQKPLSVETKVVSDAIDLFGSLVRVKK
jgi:DNA polymerase-3 subunit gamma/tau